MPDPAWLQLLTNLQRATSGDEIDAALQVIQQAFKDEFISGLARQLARVPQHGADAILEDAESILNDVLVKLWQRSRTFRGQSDAEAQTWVRQIINNTLRDAIKTQIRRERIWQPVLSYLRGRAERQTRPQSTDDEDAAFPSTTE